MTREEIINEIKCLLSELDNGEDAVSYLTQNDIKWLNENIKALEQEPCEDCISRKDTLKKFKQTYFDNDTVIRCAELVLGSMPSITPQPYTESERKERMDKSVKLIIELPEKIYESILNETYCGIISEGIYNALKNGVLLPERYGEIGDLDTDTEETKISH